MYTVYAHENDDNSGCENDDNSGCENDDNSGRENDDNTGPLLPKSFLLSLHLDVEMLARMQTLST